VTAGEQPQAEGSRKRSDSHDEAEAAKARSARSRPDSARRAERDWSTSNARRRRPRGVRVGAPLPGLRRPRGVGVGAWSGVLEAVKNCGEGGTSLGLGLGVRRLERSRKGEAAGSPRLMADGEGRSRRFGGRPPWIREGSRGARGIGGKGTVAFELLGTGSVFGV